MHFVPSFPEMTSTMNQNGQASLDFMKRISLPGWEQARGPAIAAICLALITAQIALLMRHFQVGFTATDSSSAEGFYRLIDAPLARNQLVLACLSAAIERQGLARRYLQKGDCPGGAEPVLKAAIGLPGDLVEVEPEGISVNGVRFANSRTVQRDSHGRRLLHVAWGARRVRTDEVWLFGFNNGRSWDSRYFGPVPLHSIRGVARPVLTW